MSWGPQHHVPITRGADGNLNWSTENHSHRAVDIRDALVQHWSLPLNPAQVAARDALIAILANDVTYEPGDPPIDWSLGNCQVFWKHIADLFYSGRLYGNTRVEPFTFVELQAAGVPNLASTASCERNVTTGRWVERVRFNTWEFFDNLPTRLDKRTRILHALCKISVSAVMDLMACKCLACRQTNEDEATLFRDLFRAFGIMLMGETGMFQAFLTEQIAIDPFGADYDATGAAIP